MQISIFLLVLNLNLVLCKKKLIENDIVAPKKEAPWHVSIQSPNKKHLCSGAIISHKFIVTTAQCVKVGDVSKYRLVVGSNDLRNANQDNIYNIEYVLMHPHYDKPKKANDIALIHTTKSIKFNSRVKVIKTDVDYLSTNTKVSFSGFGWRKQVSVNDRLKKRLVKLNVISHDECLRAYSKMVRNPIDIGHLCLTGPTNKDYCNQESGVPLVYRNKLVGLSSFGPGCGDGQPYVATRISFFSDFIRTKSLGCARCMKIQGFVSRFFEL